jgi:uncharacterized protein YjbI with pentapeptide repeats
MTTEGPPRTNTPAGETPDLDSLRSTVIDAAGVCVSLWISYLFVLLYLFIAVGEITHRDLFLENPVKLPFLNVDMPLVGFFAFGPGLLLVVHSYIMIHFALLADKVSVFRTGLIAQIKEPARNSLRRLLPSNIFLQLLVGPRESVFGVLGSMLRLIAWFTLVAWPLALLIFFQLQFLPFHDQGITWWQRIAVVLDLTLLWMMWPSIARGRTTTITWQDLGKRGRAVIDLLARPAALWAAMALAARRTPGRIRRHRVSYAAAFASFLVVCLVFPIATFPGEWLYSLPPLHFIPWKHEKENPWSPSWDLKSLHELLVGGDVDLGARRAVSLWSNRLMLPDIDVIDHDKYDSEVKIANLESTVALRMRHLEGAVLIGAKLRKADFTGAWLQDAHLVGADLREAIFECAVSEKECSKLRGASFRGARLAGASLVRADLQGATLDGAGLQGAKLLSARMQGAILDGAQLQGATLDSAQLQGASLRNASLQGAVLDYAQLQGSDLSSARLQGASLDHAQLQGALLEGAQLRAASFRNVSVWRADARKANDAHGATVIDADRKTDPGCLRTNADVGEPCDSLSLWLTQLEHIVASNTSSDEARRNAIGRIARLDPAKPVEGEQEIIAYWTELNASSLLASADSTVQQLRATGCAAQGAPYVARQMLDRFGTLDTGQATKLAEAFLDVEHCSGAKGLTEAEKANLQEIRQSAGSRQ